MRAKQSDFFSDDRRVGPRRLAHGGSSSRGRAKSMRPLDRKRSVHVVMRSSKARGALSLRSCRERRARVESIVHSQAKRFGVRVLSFANVGNHLHAVARFPSRASFQAWLRSASGLIARAATGARKGKPFGKFWDALAFSRVVNEGRDLARALAYVEANKVEAREGQRAREIFLAEEAPRWTRGKKARPG